ncbi:general secretion pathway protein GspB [Photobacterium sp. TY1-4]|uniref:general secretion pathway protein GspB n=1 Tax=Photobacterium sp. TY1-4 TaxID=2899122 RepID=UPI0021BE277C|nr:general secretion pathway protein GspB [Photobacterium sp. TY1-4]UXI00965.1 general secretion pathway protein GspB [Photobacterium sp. TY1-4]
MSNLLKAIAQSEQQHQQQPAPARYRRSSPADASRRWPSWVAPTLLMLTPVAATLAYSSLLSASGEMSPVVVPQPRMVQGPVAQVHREVSTPAPHSTLVSADAVGGVRFLPYPELRTEPLPVAGSVSAVESAASGRGRPALAAELSAEPAAVIPVSGEPQATDAAAWGLEGLDYSELSPLLAAQLKSAIAATDEAPKSLPSVPAQRAEPALSTIALGELPAAVQSRIPTLNFQTHIYSSSANSRWVKVNGREAFEGDEIAPGVILRRIEPRQVVFDFESYLVAMPALSEW